MCLFSRSSGGIALVVLALAVAPSVVRAQDRNGEAASLLTAAMDAYSNLELEKAKGMLEQALGLKDDLDNETLAKVHIGFGVLWAGGYSNSTESKKSFITALCLDENAKVDPLFSTPEIDQSFTESKGEISTATCREFGIGPATLEPCGYHEPFVDQRKGYELPFYLEINPAFNYELNRVAVKYTFDGKSQYRTLNLEEIGAGFGGMVECDSGEIRSVNPSSVQYYIEGYDSSDNVICKQGSEETPLEVLMSSDVPIVSRPGLNPQACSASAKKAEGQSCSMTSECRDGLICNEDTFMCESEKEDKPKSGGDKGPKKFYVNLTAGTGVGFVNKEITIRRYNDKGEPSDNIADFDTATAEALAPYTTGSVDTIPNNPKGMSWAGIPIRLTVGYKINPKLAIELSGRFDGFVISNSEPKTCWDYSGQDVGKLRGTTSDYCTTDFAGYLESDAGNPSLDDSEIEEIAKNSAGKESPGKLKTVKEFQAAWLINARLRYSFLVKKGFQASFFGGLGYGHIQYRVKDKSTGKYYYPLPGMVDIELGLGIGYYFNDHVGIVFDIPIDFLVGDGFAANFDFNLGLSFGF